MNHRYLLCGIIAILLCTLSGCNSADLTAQLMGANAYASRVGTLMQARGHAGFPSDPISYALYARDLADCIREARETSGTAMLSSLGADVARPRVVEPDGRGLAEAFGAHGGGTVVVE
jgi:hypothetical protein